MGWGSFVSGLWCEAPACSGDEYPHYTEVIYIKSIRLVLVMIILVIIVKIKTILINILLIKIIITISCILGMKDRAFWRGKDRGLDLDEQAGPEATHFRTVAFANQGSYSFRV